MWTLTKRSIDQKDRSQFWQLRLFVGENILKLLNELCFPYQIHLMALQMISLQFIKFGFLTKLIAGIISIFPNERSVWYQWTLDVNVASQPSHAIPRLDAIELQAAEKPVPVPWPGPWYHPSQAPCTLSLKIKHSYESVCCAAPPLHPTLFWLRFTGPSFIQTTGCSALKAFSLPVNSQC